MIDHNNNDDIAEMAAAYALNALSPVEASMMEQHLRSCDRCREAVAEMRGVVGLLPYSVDLVEPPAHVKTRLMDRIRTESTPRPVTAPAAAPIEQPQQARGGFWSTLFGRTFPLAAATAALVLLLGMSAVVVQQRRELGQLREAYALMTAPQTQAATMRAGDIQAKMYAAPNMEKAYLVVEGLPRLPEGRDYQVWLKEGDRFVSAGVFHPNGRGEWMLEAPETIGNYEWIGITQEPSGGSPGPTTEPIMGGDL